MKQFILFALLAAGLHANAQTEKGNFLVGAQLAGVSGFVDRGDNLFNIVLSPKAGHFITDKFVLGAGVNLGATFYGYGTGITFGLLPFSRYYFGSGKSVFFAEADLGYSIYSSFHREADREVVHHTFIHSFSAGPGFAHFINPNVGLEALLKMRGVIQDGGVALQPSLDLGFQIYLNGNKRSKQIENTQQ